MMTEERIQIESKRAYYATGVTRDLNFRVEALRRLKKMIIENEHEISRALWNDLHKSEGEGYLTETGIVLNEIRDCIRNLRRWSRERKVSTPLFLFPSRGRILFEPYGIVLIIAPWNYPFQLLMMPLIGAIAAGNVAVLKPSPYAPAVSKVISRILNGVFRQEYVSVFNGGEEEVEALLKERFDYIFFTGGIRFGQKVMEAAAKQLIPVTLELGGKSPCIVGEGCNMRLTARRIAWGKFLNAGQTCVAPDYVLIPSHLKNDFITQMKSAVFSFWGEEPKNSPDYGRIVHEAGTKRLINLMHSSGKVIHGGEYSIVDRYIAPTLLDEIEPDSPIMQEEIFGPLLPIIGYEHIRKAIEFVNKRDKPLALYYFGNVKEGKQVVGSTSSGGGCINDTIMHLANARLPFGGVGRSGMGKYHGKASFELFSNRRAILRSFSWMDIPLRYPPYKVNWIKKFLN